MLRRPRIARSVPAIRPFCPRLHRHNARPSTRIPEHAMHSAPFAAALVVASVATTASAATPADLQPIECDACTGWNVPQPAFRLHGNSWYVGVKGLSAVLIDSGDGLVLIDGGLPQSAPQIAANIAAAGKRIEDVRWIVNSHAHFDHAGGIAALQRMSGAKVAASPAGAVGLRRGNTTDDDPQAGFGERENAFPPVANVEEIADGAHIALGNLQLTAHYTPGHTGGGTTWSWQSCQEDDCVRIVYADSLTAVSAPGFRFSDDAARVAQFRATFARVRDLQCDIVVPTHPGEALFERSARPESERDRFVDRDGCKRLADVAAQRLDERLQQEAQDAAKPAG
jgi:metallo-beta-lactamase class B